MIDVLWHIGWVLGKGFLIVFFVAVILALVRAEIVRGIREMMTHHYKLKTEFLEKFKDEANRPSPRRTGSSYN